MTHIEISNFPKTISLSQEAFIKALENSISSLFELQNISVVFVSPFEIQRLNREYRKIDKQTDVLSFEINTKELLGEVYVCPEFILNNYKEEEIFRAIIHGILHLYGYDHSTEFTDSKKGLEKMFEIQENILTKLIGKLK